MERDRRFPIQSRYNRYGGGETLSIPWSLAEFLYERCGQIWHHDQSLERLAERGGWGTGELGTMLLGIDVMGRDRRMDSLLDSLLEWFLPSSEGEREAVCAECGGYVLSGVPGSGEPKAWCPHHPHAAVVERPTYDALASDLQAALQRAEEAEERADRIHCAAALDAEEADECSDAYREALERIAEKCESDPRNQEPEAVAKFAREVLADTKEDG